MLLVLAGHPDPDVAVDISVHFWYSVLMPQEYPLHIMSICTRMMRHFYEKPSTPFPLGDRSTLNIDDQDVLEDTQGWFRHYLDPSSMSAEKASLEYSRIMSVPSRRDFVDKIKASLRPSHRLAFTRFRETGVMLPFGATHAHFNYANSSLFSPQGRWLQTDFSNPLEGWECVFFY